MATPPIDAILLVGCFWTGGFTGCIPQTSPYSYYQSISGCEQIKNDPNHGFVQMMERHPNIRYFCRPKSELCYVSKNPARGMMAVCDQDDQKEFLAPMKRLPPPEVLNQLVPPEVLKQLAPLLTR
jgi:hypothetical protein